jgi:hypothetical protein
LPARRESVASRPHGTVPSASDAGPWRGPRAWAPRSRGSCRIGTEHRARPDAPEGGARKRPSPGAAFGRFARGLASAVDTLEGVGEPVPAEQIREHGPLLRQARARIDALFEEVEGVFA